MRPVICKGDPTSHGGKVLEGDEQIRALGRPVALMGHQTQCPKCKGVFPITEGFATAFGHGKKIVLDGMKTACGATVIATQQSFAVDGGSGGGQASASESEDEAASESDDAANDGSPANLVATAGAAVQAPPAAGQPELSATFQAIDDTTGKPVGGLNYTIVLPDGSKLHGTTDEEGRTETVRGRDPASVSLFWDSVTPGEGGKGHDDSTDACC